MTDATRALTFGQVAEEYDWWRPSYPDAAVDWLAPPTPAREAFGYGMADFRWITINAMKSAFLPFDERLAIIDEVIKPAYAVLGAMS